MARRFVEDISYQAFAADELRLYAVTRCLEIISEASRRLPDEMKARHADVPWRQIAGSGNFYRHDYEDVLPGILWNTVLHHLAVLERAVSEELEGQV
ncbi:MAG TPA: HepT-like ribonuclease domain-containing protein [Rhizobiaceae bacterium]|nr:HepT-like ribonuclease domain-containing protein [Rhizobiaceae bacterium]